MNRTHLVRFAGAAIVCAVAGVVWCEENAKPTATGPGGTDDTARSLLFDAQGGERAKPLVDAFRSVYLYRADEKACNAALDRLFAVLQRGKGYSRVVAARALLLFLNDAHPTYLTRERAEILAANVIELARPIPEPLREVFARQGYPRELRERIWPRVRVRVDDMDVVLREGLPEGWKPIKGTITVDGNVARERDVYFGNAPQDAIPKDLFPSILRSPIAGEHVFKATLVVHTPHGDEITLSDSATVRFSTDQEIDGPR